jgi:hypothetical protein
VTDHSQPRRTWTAVATDRLAAELRRVFWDHGLDPDASQIVLAAGFLMRRTEAMRAAGEITDEEAQATCHLLGELAAAGLTFV